MIARLDRYLFDPVPAVRPYLVLRGTLLLLGFDMWLTRIEHGGRYGAGGFNVAHWEWLDLVQPAVSPELYIGVATLTGLFALTLGLAPRTPRAVLLALALLHTWSWAMSMLDSYQHHYLLSLALAAFVFFPALRSPDIVGPLGAERRTAPKMEVARPARGKKSGKRARREAAVEREERAPAPRPLAITSAWGYSMLAVSCGIVYCYTAWSKTAPDWLSGATLRNITSGGAPLRPIMEVFLDLGFDEEGFWWFMGHSVVLVQLVIAAGYFLAPLRDRLRSRLVDFFSWAAFFTALSFHLGAEYMELEIGWFSWYMVLYAGAYLLPSRWLVPLVEVVTVPVRALSQGLAEARPPSAAVVMGMAGGSAVVLGLVGRVIDVPGAYAACVVGGVALATAAMALALSARAGEVRAYLASAAIAAACLWISMEGSTVRFDYYRNVGGDYRRRDELPQSLEAYEKANRYAPEGEDRARQEREVRELMRARGLLP